MDQIKKSLDEGFRRIRGKIELVKKPHVGVKKWIETHIPSASSSLMSLATLNENTESESSTTSGPSTCSNSNMKDAYHLTEMPAKPSRFMSINVELLDVFEDDDNIKMRAILEKGLDPNFVDLNGKPLVYRAVEDKKYRILDTMLDFGFGCDINTTCQNDVNFGWATIHLACHLGDLKAIEILLGVNLEQSVRREPCDVNAVDIDKRNPLHILSSSPYWTVTNSDGITFQSENKKCTQDKSPVNDGSVSTPSVDEEGLQSEASATAPIPTCSNTTGTKMKTSQSALYSKMSTSRKLSDHAQIMKLLIKAGCHVNQLDEFNGTPLHICASRGNLEGVKILLRYGADPGLVDSKCETALMKSISHLHPQCTRTLLKVEHSMSDDRRMELSECVLQLIEDAHSNPLDTSEDKMYSLQVVETIKLLLKKRIDLNVTDCRRRTPLHLAVLYGLHNIAFAILAQPSCDVTKQDDEGFTALFLAAWNPKKVGDNSDVLESLISRGASVTQRDHFGIYPVNAALESGQYKHACVLIAHEPDPKHVNSFRWFCASLERLSRNSSTLPFVERFILSHINRYHRSPRTLETTTILGKYDIMRAVAKAGADRSQVNVALLLRWVHDDAHEYLTQELETNVSFLQELCTGPLSLKDLCRLEIRTYLKTPLHQKINNLPIPEVLRKFLKMSKYYEKT